MKKSQGLNPKLLLRLGINPSQVDSGQISCNKPMPKYWQGEIDNAQQHILSILPLEISHWQIPIETIQKVFDEYKIIGSWRKPEGNLATVIMLRKE